MTLKRDLVKYVRDKAKSQYKKDTECYICGSQENLDFHHYNGLTELLDIWLRKNSIAKNYTTRLLPCVMNIIYNCTQSMAKDPKS